MSVRLHTPHFEAVLSDESLAFFFPKTPMQRLERSDVEALTRFLNQHAGVEPLPPANEGAIAQPSGVDLALYGALSEALQAVAFFEAVIRVTAGDELNIILSPDETWQILSAGVATQNEEDYSRFGCLVLSIPPLSKDAYEELVREAGTQKVSILAFTFANSDFYTEMQDLLLQHLHEAARKQAGGEAQ